MRCWEEKGFVWASIANFGHTYVPGGEDVGYYRTRTMREPSLLHGLVVCGRGHGDGKERAMAYQHPADGRTWWQCPWRADPRLKKCKGYISARVLEEAAWARYCDLATHPVQLLELWLRSTEHLAKQYEQARRRHSLLLGDLAERQDAADRIDLALLGKPGEEERYARLSAKAQAAVAEMRRLVVEAAHEMAQYAEVPGICGFDDIAGPMTEIADTVGVEEAERILKVALEKTLGAKTQEKLEAMDADERRRRIHTLMEKIVVTEDGAYMVALLPGASGALCIRGGDGPLSPT